MLTKKEIDSRSRAKVENSAVFFRSLSTMISAGIPLHEGLHLIAESTEDEGTAVITAEVASMIASGHTLSRALMTFPAAFSSYTVGLIRVGEKTGALARILNTLADHMEKSNALRLKLKSSVTYPSILICGSLIMLFVAPSWLLKGQLTMLQDSGTELPALTKVMITWTNFCSSPVFVLLSVLTIAGAVYHLRNRSNQERILVHSHRIPMLSKFAILAATARFSRSLEIALKAGLPVLQALPLSAEATGDPLLKRRIETVKRELIAGDTLAQALESIAFFAPSFEQLVTAGEESGKLPVMLALSAEFAELELDLALKQATVLVEPILLLGMGIFTALVLVATLQPTIALLQAL